MFDFDFCNALPVWARVGSGTITVIYYYYYYEYYSKYSFTVLKGNCEYLKGGYSKCWERLQQSYKNQNIYGHEVQTAN